MIGFCNGIMHLRKQGWNQPKFGRQDVNQRFVFLADFFRCLRTVSPSARVSFRGGLFNAWAIACSGVRGQSEKGLRRSFFFAAIGGIIPDVQGKGRPIPGAQLTDVSWCSRLRRLASW